MKKSTKILFKLIKLIYFITDELIKFTLFRIIFVREDRIGHQSGGFEMDREVRECVRIHVLKRLSKTLHRAPKN